MPYDIDTEPIIIRTAATVALPPGNPTAPEWAALVGRVTALEGLGVVDLTDVDLTDLADGLALVWDAASGTWRPGSAGGSLDLVQSLAVDVLTDVRSINFTSGLAAIQSSTAPDRVNAFVVFGGTGTLNSVARSDHTHQLRPRVGFPFPASGSMSSGTRTLVSGTITGLDPERTHIIDGTVKMQLRGEGAGAGYSLPRVTINAVTVADVEPVRTVSGVPHTTVLEHEGITISGVSSLSVSATLAYSEGDPIYVGAGKLVIRITSNR